MMDDFFAGRLTEEEYKDLIKARQRDYDIRQLRKATMGNTQAQQEQFIRLRTLIRGVPLDDLMRAIKGEIPARPDMGKKEVDELCKVFGQLAWDMIAVPNTQLENDDG